MAPLTWWISLAIVAPFHIANAVSTTKSNVVCTDAPSPNLVANPSFENGLSGWSFSNAGATQSSTYASDGSHSAMIPSNGGYIYVQQTISGLKSGTEYSASMDLLGLVNQQYAVTEQCFIYLWHDALTTSNLIQQVSPLFNRNSQWQTLSGKFTPTSNSALLGFYASCTPYKTGTIFNLYIDNFIVEVSSPAQSCTTTTPSATPTITPSAIATTSSLAVSISSSMSSPAAVLSSHVSPPSSSHLASSAAVAASSSHVSPSSSSHLVSSSAVVASSSLSILPSPSSSRHLISSRPVSALPSPSLTRSSRRRIRPSCTASLTPHVSPSSSGHLISSSHVQASSSSTSTIIVSSPAASLSAGASSSADSHQTTVSNTDTSSAAASSSSQPVSPGGGVSSQPAPGATGTSGGSQQATTTSAGQGSATITATSTLQLTTSTVLTTRTSTVTACPSSVTNCPARSTFVTTETIVVSTTICPVTATELPSTQTAVPAEHLTTSTIFSTRTATITACPSSVHDCPASSKTTFVTTETVLVSTTVCPVTEASASTTAIGDQGLPFAPQATMTGWASPVGSTGVGAQGSQDDSLTVPVAGGLPGVGTQGTADISSTLDMINGLLGIGEQGSTDTSSALPATSPNYVGGSGIGPIPSPAGQGSSGFASSTRAHGATQPQRTPITSSTQASPTETTVSSAPVPFNGSATFKLPGKSLSFILSAVVGLLILG